MSSNTNFEQDIVAAGKTKRIIAIDLLRGFFLIVIMVDHIELYPNLYDAFTGKGRLWVSAAEGFFFMSGLLIGMIYRRRLHLGMKYIFKKMWTRALELWAIGVGLTFLFLAWVEFTHHSPVKDALANPFPWHHYIEQALLMRFTYGWADFLVRFAILMLIAPFVFYLIAKGKWWLALIGILTAWAFRGEGFTLAWQLIFNIGILIGFYWNDLESRYQSYTAQRRQRLKIGFGLTALVTFLISYSAIFLLSFIFYLWGAGHLAAPLQHVAYDLGNWNYDVWLYADKWRLGPVRVVLFFIWFPVLFWIFRRYETRINRYTRGILAFLGSNSLLVYVVHAFIVFIFKMYLIPSRTNLAVNFLITTVGLILLVIVSKLAKRLQLTLAKTGSVRLKSLLDSKVS